MALAMLLGLSSTLSGCDDSSDKLGDKLTFEVNMTFIPVIIQGAKFSKL